MVDMLMEQFRESSLQDGTKEKKKNARKIMNMALHVCNTARIRSVYELGSSSHLQRVETLYIAKEDAAANTIANHLRALGNFVSFLAFNDYLGLNFTEHMKQVFMYKREVSQTFEQTHQDRDGTASVKGSRYNPFIHAESFHTYHQSFST